MKQNPKQQIADDLKQRVLSMELAPGEALDEVLLSSQYGISRTPLREVIQRLSGEGYLTLEENRGAKVASLDLMTLRHFFQSAPMIYAAIAKLAAEHAEKADISALKEIQFSFRKSIADGDPSNASLHNHRFHEAIGEMAASPYLMPSLNRLLIEHTRIGQVFYRSQSAEEEQRVSKAADQHDAMIEAFANHDPTGAVELTLQHWELSRGQMERFVSPDPLPFDLEDYSDAV